jgi:diacylglycerol kinase (ATP)
MEPACIIFNPAARGQKARRLYRRLCSIASGVPIYCTEKGGDARRLAEEAVAKGYRLVVAAGGDGTVNEVVNGIAGRPVVFGVLPLGTVNVFAWELGLPRGLEAAWRVVRDGTTRKLDLGRANQRYFVQMLGVGLDAQALLETSLEFRRLLGPASYILRALAIAGGRSAPQLKIESCGRACLQGQFLLVGNGRFYGGPFSVFPGARPDDGWLDVCLFGEINLLSLLRYTAGVLSRRHPNLRGVKYLQCQNLRIQAEKDVPFQVDGEPAGRLPCSVEIFPSLLTVRVRAEGTGKPVGGQQAF